MADKWTPSVIQDALDLNYDVFAEKHGAEFTTYDGWRRVRWQVMNGRLSAKVAADLIVPRPKKPEFHGPIRLEHATVAACSDLHAPYHNETMLRRFLWLAKKRKIRTAVIGGDLFNLDSISRHGLNIKSTSVIDELASVKQVLRSFMQTFEAVYITLGNHDRRFSKRLDSPVSFQFMIDGALGEERGHTRFIGSDCDYVYLDHPAGESRSWMIGHPSSYSGLGGKTPSEIALLEHRNVVAAHNHVVGMSQSKCGRYIGIDSGHMTDPNSHQYLVESMTKYARWNSGFVLIEDGYAELYTELYTNWERLGCS